MLTREDPAVDKAVDKALVDIIAVAGDTPDSEKPLSATTMPVMPIELTLEDNNLGFFSVISNLGTPANVTSDELRIEAFYLSDQTTLHFFKTLTLE